MSTIIIEKSGGMFQCKTVIGDTISTGVLFGKDSDKYNELIAKGCKVELLPQDEKDAYEDEQVKAGIISEISILEAKVTPRRAREAMLTGDYSFIQGVEDQIKALSVRKDDKA